MLQIKKYLLHFKIVSKSGYLIMLKKTEHDIFDDSFWTHVFDLLGINLVCSSVFISDSHLSLFTALTICILLVSHRSKSQNIIYLHEKNS